ncbi:hypothetical protein NEQG_00834 [Nematocida parisii ERTm3]|uniref:Retrotransposon gag domain-containing protein n=2 Tax=Nematocida parisii TaxID=586133 RepID=I3EIG8_NEMP3|nr:hypothetical protein NEQG_00834 [Nematocida parisii ERTm3]
MVTKAELEKMLENVRNAVMGPRITERTIKWDIRDIEEKGLQTEVIMAPRETMETDIWIWWMKVLEEERKRIEGRGTWEEFKERALQNFHKEKGQEIMPAIVQTARESMEDWIRRVERVAKDVGASKEVIKEKLCVGIYNGQLRGKALKWKNQSINLEELKQGIMLESENMKYRGRAQQGRRARREGK